jgi:glycosyltransferase involved in cell wall biosynthesis
MKVAIHGLSATAGGGRTYLLNLARTLPALAPHQYRLYAPLAAATDLADLPKSFRVLHCAWAERSYAARSFWEQFVLPREVKRWGADVLLCLGNFCPLRSQVPVVLLSRNALYFTPRYSRDLWERGHWLWVARHLLMSRLALRSVRAARLTIVPTDAMGEMIRSASAGSPPRLQTISHGFQPWPPGNGKASEGPPEPPPFRFLVISHYNYYRNFETIFRALALLHAEGRPVRLILSTRLQPGLRLGGYDTTIASRLLDELGIRELVTTLGSVAYDDLPSAYRSAHSVICASYTESFGMTVVEAMALGTPVIASDIPAHREVARGAALFFPPMAPGDLAARCRELMDSPGLRDRLRAAGVERAQDFSWHRHFQALIHVAARAAGGAYA